MRRAAATSPSRRRSPSPTGAPPWPAAPWRERLPTELYGQPARSTVPVDGTTAAWGDPPIVLRCGVPRPAELTPTSTLVEVEGVSWYPEELSAGYRFTSTGREANVEVTVPAPTGPRSIRWWASARSSRHRACDRVTEGDTAGMRRPPPGADGVAESLDVPPDG